MPCLTSLWQLVCACECVYIWQDALVVLLNVFEHLQIGPIIIVWIFERSYLYLRVCMCAWAFVCACVVWLCVCVCVEGWGEGRGLARRDKSDRYWSSLFQLSKGLSSLCALGRVLSTPRGREGQPQSMSVPPLGATGSVWIYLYFLFILTDSSKIRHVSKCTSNVIKNIHLWILASCFSFVPGKNNENSNDKLNNRTRKFKLKTHTVSL